MNYPTISNKQKYQVLCHFKACYKAQFIPHAWILRRTSLRTRHDRPPTNTQHTYIDPKSPHTRQLWIRESNGSKLPSIFRQAASLNGLLKRKFSSLVGMSMCIMRCSWQYEISLRHPNNICSIFTHDIAAIFVCEFSTVYISYIQFFFYIMSLI